MSDTFPVLPPAPASIVVGFLSITHDPGGVLGGYLVTNAWGRPLEFRLTTAVQPTRVQQILYGPTLTEYLHADLIGKTLIEKTGTQPHLVVTDSVPALALRWRVGLPAVALGAGDAPPDVLTLTHPRSSVPLLIPARCVGERDAIAQRLDALDPAVDVAEPFARIREAVAEARKMGGVNRAA